MKKASQLVLAVLVTGIVAAGCGKSEKPKPKPAKPAKATKTEKWEPESVSVPEGHSADDGHDHSGHDH
jgi:nitrous oxide reductase accessory protein NosL